MSQTGSPRCAFRLPVQEAAFTTLRDRRARLTAEPRCSRRGQSGDGGAFGVWGLVTACGASVRGGRRVQCPGPESGLDGQSWRKVPGPRMGARGPARLRLDAAVGPRAMGSACCAAGAPARTQRRVTAYCGSSWGLPAVALTAFPRTRRWVLHPGPRCPSEPVPWRGGILLQRPLWATSLQYLLRFAQDLPNGDLDHWKKSFKPGAVCKRSVDYHALSQIHWTDWRINLPLKDMNF